MKYVKKFEQRLIDADQEVEDLEYSPEESEPINNNVSMKGEHWYAEMEGKGDYRVSFKNPDGEETIATFKDTGNRRDEGDMMYAAFIGLRGQSSDGRDYVAEACMKKKSEGEYEIISFVVYENQF